MKIHVFNPEHDLALAHNGCHFTPPHAARELRSDLGYIPALWADDGDIVLVEDVKYAEKAARRYRHQVANVLFVTADELRDISKKLFPYTQVSFSVWGWDMAVRQQFLDSGIPSQLLPDKAAIVHVRELSSRMTAVHLLPLLRELNGTVGASMACSSADDLSVAIKEWGRVVLKAPWSSSGRGIKYVSSELTPSQSGWFQRTIHHQGLVVAEAYNNKVLDFAMEFYAHPDGQVTYEGLSLFQTQNGAYTGNLLATEAEKMRRLNAWLPLDLVEGVKMRIVNYMSQQLKGVYNGPFGVDMMVVAKSDGDCFLLNPCVEINLRRTMGHVALSLTPTRMQPIRVMRVVHQTRYILRSSPFKEDIIIK